MRVHAVSDIHADYPANLKWVMQLSEQDFREDVLVLAGDISDDLALVERVLKVCVDRFADVLFVPGNHDFWVQRGEHDCSLDKHEALRSLCRECDVGVDFFSKEHVLFAPLLSWYDFSFGSIDRKLRLGWRDFQACRWPESLAEPQALADHFHSLNEPIIDQVQIARASLQERGVEPILISCSHFVPNIDLMPSWIPASRRNVYPVLGSAALGEQVTGIAPDIHIYGHSHVNQVRKVGNTCYINNAFATPQESRIAAKQLCCVYDNADPDVIPRLLEMSERGGLWR